MEIRIIINEHVNRGSKRYRATPEQIQRNRDEIRVQKEREQRAYEKAYPNSNNNTTQDSSTQS